MSAVTVQVRYFGPLLDVTGVSRESLEVTLPDTLRGLERQIHQRWPGLAEAVYRIAVDETLCQPDETVESAREIALLPAFSGG